MPLKYVEQKKEPPETLNKWYLVHLPISMHSQHTRKISDPANLTPKLEDADHTEETIVAVEAEAKLAVEVILVTTNVQSQEVVQEKDQDQNRKPVMSVLDVENPVILKMTAGPRQPNVTTVTKLGT